MIRYDDALALIHQQTTPIETASMPLAAALGKVAARNYTSAISLPSFRNSAMDGFAVRHAEIAAASAEMPVILPILQTIAAGDAIKAASDKGSAQIMTGAAVPDGYDAVVVIEEVTVNGDSVHFTKPAKAGQNIRLAGEDIAHGQHVMRRGDIITPERLMLLAAVGLNAVDVFQLPLLHVFATGKELVDQGAPLREGKIYNSNAPYLMACAQAEGLAAQYGGIIADDAAVFERTIAALAPPSIIITTGAVSKGTWDFIPESLNRLGAVTHFHRVNIRPGKPVLFATLPNGSWFFGLPGNPISAAIGFRFFVKPLLRALQGLAPEQPMMAKLTRGFTKKGDFRQFLKAAVHVNAKGELMVDISSGQESFKIAPLAESNAWAMLMEERNDYPAGTTIPVYLFHPTFMPQSREELVCKAA